MLNADNFDSPSFLILGVGQLGSCIAKLALQKNHPVHAVDHEADLLMLRQLGIIQKLKLIDKSFLQLEEFRDQLPSSIDTLVLCGGDSPADISISDDSSLVCNSYFEGVKNIADTLNINRVIYVSSFSVYGSPLHSPSEESELLPVSPYGVLKKNIEIQLSSHFGDKLLILRPCGSVGHKSNGRMSKSSELIFDVVSAMEKSDGKLLSLPDFNLGEIIWSFDVAAAILALVEKPNLQHQIYNLGTGIELATSQLAAAIERVWPLAILRVPEILVSQPQIPILDISRLSWEDIFIEKREVDFLIDYVRGL